MYQSQVRSDIGRELVAEQQPKQHHPGSRVDPDAIRSTTSSQQSLLYASRPGAIVALAMTTCFLITVLSGCGGLVFNRSGAISRNTSSSTTSVLSSISCGTQSLTGAQSKACSVYLSAPATTTTTVQLTSSNAALQVPSGVMISADHISTGFNAVSAAVNNTVSVTIKGAAGGVTKSDVITLYPEATAGSVTLSKVSCGTQSLTGPTTKACSVYLSGAASNSTSVALTSDSTALQVPSAVTVPSGAMTGGFNVTASAVATTESVTLTATSGGVSRNYLIQLLGSGTQTTSQYAVQLSWNAPGGSTSSIAGYRVYRANVGATSYQLLNSALDLKTSFSDATVQSGKSYEYEVKSVDSSGTESAPSGPALFTIP